MGTKTTSNSPQVKHSVYLLVSCFCVGLVLYVANLNLSTYFVKVGDPEGWYLNQTALNRIEPLVSYVKRQSASRDKDKGKNKDKDKFLIHIWHPDCLCNLVSYRHIESVFRQAEANGYLVHLYHLPQDRNIGGGAPKDIYSRAYDGKNQGTAHSTEQSATQSTTQGTDIDKNKETNIDKNDENIRATIEESKIGTKYVSDTSSKQNFGSYKSTELPSELLSSVINTPSLMLVNSNSSVPLLYAGSYGEGSFCTADNVSLIQTLLETRDHKHNQTIFEISGEGCYCGNNIQGK